MRIPEALIDGVRADVKSGLLEACEFVLTQVPKQPNARAWTDDDLELLVECYSLIVEIIESKIADLKFGYPEFKGRGTADCEELRIFVASVAMNLRRQNAIDRVEIMRGRFRASLGHCFAYEFSQGDLARVQTLLDELRKEISSNTGLESAHRQRLLKRLETLQQELHKRVSDLDRFWGLVGDAGVILGKLGQDAKPLVDRMKEIAGIVWRTQSRSEELPSDAQIPSIGHENSNRPE